ncbi:MAG: putative DNA-binding domain-containing protein [Bradyrhizobiaceae bacterium]|nr:putative DNA-binding domain-containing protein [Bradyrhizobiaceae bacterium]
MFESTQQCFSAALLDPERPVPEALTSHTARVPQKRFAVYRNNVVTGLVDALAGRFPATQRIVGEEFFRAMARLYVTAEPPRSPLLMQYGETFADFIARFEPAAEVEYLADVARIEAARMRVYHAADAAPLDAKRLQNIDNSALGELRFARHPSAEIVRSAHPVVTIWAMNAGELPLGAIEDWRGEDALIVRPSLEVHVHALPPGGAAFLFSLFSGAPLAAAATAGQAENEEFDLTVNLAGVISSGAVCEEIQS